LRRRIKWLEPVSLIYFADSADDTEAGIHLRGEIIPKPAK
jgi:hypothetical protein